MMGRFGRKAKKKKVTGRVGGLGLVLIPAQDWVWTRAVIAQKNLVTPPGTITNMIIGGGGPAEKRNVGVQTVLDDPRIEWVFFLDSDQTPESQTIMKLLGLNVPIASALYFERVPPFGPVCGLLPGQVDPDLTCGPFEVAYTGGGALLVRREVLEALAPGPYFQYIPGRMVGEDANFCHLAREAGFSILIDPDITVGHVGAVPIDRHIATAWKKIVDEGFGVPRENAHGA